MHWILRGIMFAIAVVVMGFAFFRVVWVVRLFS